MIPFNLKDLKLIIKAAVIGVFAVALFLAYTFVEFVRNHKNYTKVQLFSPEPMEYV